MSTIFDKLKSEYESAIVNKCNEQGCTVNLEELPHRVILKGENIRGAKDKKICDCFIFYVDKEINVSIVELKCSLIHASQIITKFENSVKILCDILRDFGIRKHFKLRLVLATKHHTHLIQENLLKHRICVGGRKYRIHTGPNGVKIRELESSTAKCM